MIKTIPFPQIKNAADAQAAGGKYIRTDYEHVYKCPYCSGSMERPTQEVWEVLGIEMKFYTSAIYAECRTCGNV